jgi:hypothetical protein
MTCCCCVELTAAVYDSKQKTGLLTITLFTSAVILLAMSSSEELSPQLRAQLSPLLAAELKRMNGEDADASLLDCT